MTAAEKQQYEMEFKRMIEEHISFPSIVMYVVFNEGWGQYEVCHVMLYYVKQLLFQTTNLLLLLNLPCYCQDNDTKHK